MQNPDDSEEKLQRATGENGPCAPYERELQVLQRVACDPIWVPYALSRVVTFACNCNLNPLNSTSPQILFS